MSILELLEFINVALLFIFFWKKIYLKSYTTMLYVLFIPLGLEFYRLGYEEYCYLTLTFVNFIAILRASLHRQNDKILKV